MEQLLVSLGEGLGPGLEEPAEELGEDLSREVSTVMQVLESQLAGEPVKPEVSVEERVERCREKQGLLESRYRRLQTRINRLRAERLALHAAGQLQAVVAGCDRRNQRLNGEIKPEEESGQAEPGGQSEEEGERACIRRTGRPGKRAGKGRTDEVLGQVEAAVRQVQALADPEATESSSGGESGDEQEPGPPGAVLFAPLQERAAFRWLSSRAQLASQWVWLQAQVSDLEYKIRQHTELYRAQRASKGAVALGEELVSWPAKPPAAGPGEEAGEEEASMTCARVRPVKRVRRRKVVDTYGLHHRVSKAARLATVACGCLHPEQWCVLCLGRRSHTAPLDRAVHSRVEGAALLDHSYHAVLGDGLEVPLSLALMESVASRRWMERRPPAPTPGPSGPAHLSRLLNAAELERKEKKVKKEELSHKRKYIKRKERDGKSKKRRKESGREGSRPASPTDFGDSPRDLGFKVERTRDRNSLAEQLKRKRKSNFDIDHIVIPYSMASTARVERLQYKEIITPSWKEVELVTVKPEPEGKEGEEEVKVKVEEDEEEIENMTDLMYKLMHAKAEDEERARWQTPLGRGHGTGGQRGALARERQGRARRLDSCRTEASSGANTPSNPLSPNPLDRVEELVVGTRPGSPTGLEEPATHINPGIPTLRVELTDVLRSPLSTPLPGPPPPGPPPAASLRGRRRTSSTTQRPRDRNLSEASQESSRSTSPWTEVEEAAVAPWDPRVFPLTDEDVADLEESDSRPMPPPALHQLPAQSSATVSAETSRASSRASSVEEAPGEDSADPDWDEDADDAKEEVGDDDPEYDPDARQRLKVVK